MKPDQGATVLAAYQQAQHVAEAVTVFQEAEKKANAARTELYAAIVAAAAAGVRRPDLSKITGYTSEHIRQIVKAAKESDDA